jgi:hypothetical protein
MQRAYSARHTGCVPLMFDASLACLPASSAFAFRCETHATTLTTTDARHQILEFVSKVVGAEGGPVELQVAPEMPHVFQLFAFVQEMPEINDHIAKAGAWIRSQ